MKLLLYMGREVIGWVFDYDLANKIEYVGEVYDYSDKETDFTIEIKTSGKHVTGLRIAINQSDFVYAQRRCNSYANNLKNYMIIKSGVATSIFLAGYQDIPKEKGVIHGTGYLKLMRGIDGGLGTLDLNDSHVKSIIRYTVPQSLELEYLSNAIFHRYNNNLIDCVKELFKIIEGKDFPDYQKYESLRNLFSHRLPYYQSTIDKFLKYFNENSFDYKRFEPERRLIIIDNESDRSQQVLQEIISFFIDSIKDRLRLD